MYSFLKICFLVAAGFVLTGQFSYAQTCQRPPGPDESDFFELNKGFLRVPADHVSSSCFLPGYFNRHDSTINYLRITCFANAQVFAIADGKVTGVNPIPNNGYLVVIKHGKYYSAYTSLSEPCVEKGQCVKAKEIIGRIKVREKHATVEVHLCDGYTEINAEDWFKQ